MNSIKKKRVTAKDVANLAGVSQSAVSMILNNYKNISFSEETKLRVLEACNQLGYRPLRKSWSHNEERQLLLVVCPSLYNAHYIKAINGIQKRAMELGYTSLTLCTGRREEEEANVVRVCQNLHVAGVVLIYQPNNIAMKQLLNIDIPVVQLYDRMGNLGIDIIELDNYKIGRLIAEHLIGLGHRQIAHISKPLTEKQPARIRRVEGIRSYMEEVGLDPEKCLRVCTVESEHLEGFDYLEGYDTGRLLAGQLLDRQVPVTAFAATNDTMAYGVMDAILERKKRIPQDYSVCGCDNLQDSAFQRISLTTVEPYTAEKARDAIDLLSRSMRTKEHSASVENGPISITRIEYPPKLIVRKSTGKCPEKKFK